MSAFALQRPTRRTRRSEYALWVGNIHYSAKILDLQRHFTHDGFSGIISICLHPRKNYAFVNYESETACRKALIRYDNSFILGLRLRCRLHRTATSASIICDQSETTDVEHTQWKAEVRDHSSSTILSPVIVKSTPDNIPSTLKVVSQKLCRKFFVMKSFTYQDVERSMRSGLWTTQPHNEPILTAAFEKAHEVYLVFSVNGSGEYCGYARMVTSPRSGRAKSMYTHGELGSIAVSESKNTLHGRILINSLLGTISWEVSSIEDGGAANGHFTTSDCRNEFDYGQFFRVEWISTARTPFRRVRGLRNSWNQNKEIKIARDGTEIETSLGEKLLHILR